MRFFFSGCVILLFTLLLCSVSAADPADKPEKTVVYKRHNKTIEETGTKPLIQNTTSISKSKYPYSERSFVHMPSLSEIFGSRPADVKEEPSIEPSPQKKTVLTQEQEEAQALKKRLKEAGIEYNCLSYYRKRKAESTETNETPLLFGLDLSGVEIKDISPLQGMPFVFLDLRQTSVADLSPLKGMPLDSLLLHDTQVSDLSPLKDLPSLRRLDLRATPVEDLSPLNEMLVPYLLITDTKVTDLTPLADSPLVMLWLSPDRIRKGMEVIREMDSIKWIGTDRKNLWPASEFWKKYDAGEFKSDNESSD